MAVPQPRTPPTLVTLPPELRMVIWKEALHEPLKDDQILALLRAIGDMHLYYKMAPFDHTFQRIGAESNETSNYTMTPSSEAHFKTLKMERIEEIKNLKLIMPAASSE